MSEHPKVISLKPEDLIINAFVYFKQEKGVEEIDIGSLILICTACGCPSEEIAKAVLLRMVESGILNLRKDGKTHYFALKLPAEN